MKKIIIIGFVFILIVLNSCTKEQDKLIVKNWIKKVQYFDHDKNELLYKKSIVFDTIYKSNNLSVFIGSNDTISKKLFLVDTILEQMVKNKVDFDLNASPRIQLAWKKKYKDSLFNIYQYWDYIDFNQDGHIDFGYTFNYTKKFGIIQRFIPYYNTIYELKSINYIYGNNNKLYTGINNLNIMDGNKAYYNFLQKMMGDTLE